MLTRYGKPPEDLGKFNIYPNEYCYVQYLPVWMRSVCHEGIQIPAHLSWCRELVLSAAEHVGCYKYIYLTAKHMYTNTKTCNRHGWHSDGFGTNDLNFIWYDCHPTQFCIQEFELSNNHELSMVEMEDQVRVENIIEFPNKHLLKLDQAVIHRVNPHFFDGVRTFVKISLSNSKYNLKGNAHNHLLSYKWEMFERGENRNHPTKD